MSLRVIGGAARGMKLKPVPGSSTRPIMDRVKEALFNIMGGDIRDANFLDLFAGTGSVGIEALSRGAAFARFNERDRAAIKTIHQNLAHTGLSAKARVTRRDAFDLIARSPDRRYGFIYAAPPQYKGIWLKTLEAFDANSQWHDPATRMVVQIDPSEYDTNQSHDCLSEYDQRKYGRTLLLFYRFVPANDEPTIVSVELLADLFSVPTCRAQDIIPRFSHGANLARDLRLTQQGQDSPNFRSRLYAK